MKWLWLLVLAVPIVVMVVFAFVREGAAGSAPGVMLGPVHAIERNGAEPSVVFIHGDPGSSVDFAPVMEKLAGKVHTVALDRPGYGWSERPQPRMSPTAQARVLHDAVKALKLERPVLCGFSFGGPVALAYALEYPNDISALVLIAAVANPDEGHEMGGAQALLAKPYGPLVAWTIGPLLGPSAVRDGYVDAFFPKAPDAETVARGQLQFTRPTTLLASARDWDVLRDELPKLAARYGEINVPVEVLSANQDRIVNPKHADYLIAHLKDAHRVDVDQAGHQMMSTHTEVVAQAVMRTLARLNP